MYVHVTQSDGGWSGICSYHLEGFGKVSWEITGTITSNGKIAGTLHHTCKPANWNGRQSREGQLSADGNRITGMATWHVGGQKFVWNRTVPIEN